MAGVFVREQEEEDWAPGVDARDLEALQNARNDDSKIVEEAPEEPNRMGYYSILCLVFNRMVGTGIFNSASVVFSNTQSIGISLMFWTYGFVIALSGILVYIELGLTIPRWMVQGRIFSTPRSGGELNYVSLIYP
jgi:hypothetical protein